MSEEYAAIYREEAVELLEELETALLDLEKSPGDAKIIGRVFRAMHTIKGSGAMFGFESIADFTHHVESVLGRVREGSVPVRKGLINLILQAKDHIKCLLAADSEVTPPGGEEIVAKLQRLVGDNPEEHRAYGSLPTRQPTDGSFPSRTLHTLQGGPSDRAGHASLKHYRISFRPTPEFFKEGGDVDSILFELQELGELVVTGRSKGTFAQFESGAVPAYWDMLLHAAHDEVTVRDAFGQAEKTSDVKIMELGDDGEASFPVYQRLGDILVERGEIDKRRLASVLKEQKPIGQILIEKDMVLPDKVHSALKEQKILSQRREAHVKQNDSLRVAADKLDYLINLVGEMVVNQARLAEVASRSGSVELQATSEEVARLTAELKDCVLNIRMLPIGSAFSRFKRLVRDLSGELGKEVDLVTTGAETEVDKGVIELMADPLVHLIRNCIDHGIESPEVRTALGKPKKGLISLVASYAGANVVIRVFDDGKGLDPEVLRVKALAQGLIAEDVELSRQETLDLVFRAGFSTAPTVTGLSGRGVGMDVVKNTIESRLKGAVTIDSELNKGTTVTITLPLTLAIIDGLLVKVGQTPFVVPLAQVEECMELCLDSIQHSHGRHLLAVRGQLIPYLDLHEFYGISVRNREAIQQVVVVNVNDERVGLLCGEVVGAHQAVIKSLGWVYRNAPGVSGATVLGNGEVALVADVADLIKRFGVET